ncbi:MULTISPECIES: ABC transporter permease [unclassified Actinopolyspora]|uniref:ABC transporter permease n=1 Tax=unclassified Actinopolyspora TaxID=2639451 RepID=UPI0013F5E435|nr:MULTISPECIES: ABC transporter permease [unclassified Actinopolyspora]NHD18342.1 ABC transporter permease [Actinopolyspora sp. BKK2]NHE76979.1 ABC transporter permease [Actinopolyspora sp. BKK1]
MTGSSFRTLALANARELIRDRKTAFAAIVMPLFFLVLFLAVGYFVNRSGEADAIRMLLPTALFFMLGSMSFFGTVSPAVDLRQRRTLRLLSTTPLRKIAFLGSLAPVRALVAMGYVALVVAFATAFGYVSPVRIPVLLVSAAAGVAFFLSLGFVLAAVLPSAEAANNTLSLVLVLMAFLGGGVLPLRSMPEGAQAVLGWLPPARLMETFRHSIAGLPAQHSPWSSWVIMLGASALLTMLATRVFSWDVDAR